MDIKIKSMPVIDDIQELKGNLLVCGLEVAKALEDGRIHFDRQLDRDMFLGLLMLTCNFSMDGALKNAFKPIKLTKNVTLN